MMKRQVFHTDYLTLKITARLYSLDSGIGMEDYIPVIDGTAWKRFLMAMIEAYEQRVRKEEER